MSATENSDRILMTPEDVMNLPVVPADHRLPYGTDSQQFGDLYLPEQDGPHPVVVFIHGGCWLAEVDLGHASQLCSALADEGLAVWSLEYRRLGNGGGWPGTFEDVSAGADYLRQISNRHALDLCRVVAAGHSAGGHLALWLACRHRLPLDSTLYSLDPLPLQGVVSLAGIPDLEQAVAQDICEGTPQQLVGGLPTEVPNRYRQASPSMLLPLGIPQILINGAHDPVVPVDYIKHYSEAAEQKGDDIRLDILPEAGHFEIVVPTTPEWINVKDAMLELLER